MNRGFAIASVPVAAAIEADAAAASRICSTFTIAWGSSLLQMNCLVNPSSSFTVETSPKDHSPSLVVDRHWTVAVVTASHFG